MIDKEKIEEIKQRADIVEVVGRLVPLKKVGKNYRALCPFHAEKAPSFYVNPEKGIFYCFGCKKGGNAISFLMEFEHLDFPDAVKKLGRELGIDVDTSQDLKYRELYEANEIAAQFYSLALNREVGVRCKNYLIKRSIADATVTGFRLGYAPAAGGLVAFARNKGVLLSQLEAAGLAVKNREIFYNRLIFPIFNQAGRIVGFGGRVLEERVEPKYLNSPETPIFHKGDMLYGLYQAKETVRAKNEAILVEGYFDLLTPYQAGIKNICAPLGTALTENQAQLIARHARKVTIIFDADRSGIRAALRAVGLLINAQVDVHVCVLPDECDPDEYIREHGANEFLSLIKDAPDFFTFYKQTVTVRNVEDEVALIKDLIQIVSTIRDPIRFDRYVKMISRVFEIPESTINREFQLRGKSTLPVSAPKPASQTLRSRTSVSPEMRLMSLILSNKEYLPLARSLLAVDDFRDPDLRAVYQTLNARADTVHYDITELLLDSRVRDTLLSLIIMEEKISEGEYIKALNDYKLRQVDQRKIRPKIAEAIKKNDTEALRKYQEFLRKGVRR